MSFRPWDVDQSWLLPPSVRDFVPEGHLAHFVRDTVRETLDLGPILARYEQETGRPAYHPAMMVAVLLYAYSQGVYSSRRIARACEERVDFMAVTGLEKPDHRTVNRFRGRHLQDLESLFVQVVRLCDRAGLVKLGHVALDGTKMRANASKHAAMSYGRMKDEEKKLKDVVREWMKKAEEIDAAEDEEYGPDRRGDELPDWAQNKVTRLAKIREAMAALEAEARAEAEAQAREQEEPAEAKKADPSARKTARQRKRKASSGTPDDKAQRNFTDADSRIMKTTSGFEQCYNAQAAVDASSQVIVACGLDNSATDVDHLTPMVGRIKAVTGRQAKELSADAGYCSEANLAELARRHVRAYVATGRVRHGGGMGDGHRVLPPGSRRRTMWQVLRKAGFRSRYRLRKQTVEPVFGQVKEARGFRRFLLRGLSKVQHEWTLLCTVHNLLKLAKAAT